MGLLDKLINGRKNDDDLLTDDEKDLREYEENEYSPESRLDTGAYAEFIVEDDFAVQTGTVVVGTVTGGTFHVGDKVLIVASITGTELRAEITGIEQFRKTLTSVSEGAHAGLMLKGVTTRQIKRNDIIKKISENTEGEI